MCTTLNYNRLLWKSALSLRPLISSSQHNFVNHVFTANACECIRLLLFLHTSRYHIKNTLSKPHPICRCSVRTYRNSRIIFVCRMTHPASRLVTRLSNRMLTSESGYIIGSGKIRYTECHVCFLRCDAKWATSPIANAHRIAYIYI